MQKIAPFLWFNDQAEEAVNFYTSIFRDARVTMISRYGPEGPGPEGTVMTISFQLFGQEFMALNGGPEFAFTPAISFFVNCETQAEVDEYWEKLSAGGRKDQCGWLTDKFGVTWQIVPVILGELLYGKDKNPQKSRKVMQAMLKMVKLDIQQLKDAYEGG